MSGFIKIDRKILEWEWWSDKNTSRLFLYMILKANWKEGSFKGITIPKGSFVSSLEKLAESTNLTIGETRIAIKHLKSTGEITSKSYNKFTIFTVNQYSFYQELVTNNKQESSTLYKTKENLPISPFERFKEFWQAYPKKENLLKTRNEYVLLLQTTPELTKELLITAAQNYAESCQILHTKEQSIKCPENWLKDSSWISYLPENYRKPKLPEVLEVER